MSSSDKPAAEARRGKPADNSSEAALSRPTNWRRVIREVMANLPNWWNEVENGRDRKRLRPDTRRAAKTAEAPCAHRCAAQADYAAWPVAAEAPRGTALAPARRPARFRPRPPRRAKASLRATRASANPRRACSRRCDAGGRWSG